MSKSDYSKIARELDGVSPQDVTGQDRYRHRHGSTVSLRKQNEVLAEMMRACAHRSLVPRPNHELQMQLDQVFERVQKELEMSAVYLSLYSERCNTSITIAHSLSSQRSAEVYYDVFGSLHFSTALENRSC